MSHPSRPGAGADRWLVSYADLMTLLFAFTMTLYAAAPSDPAQRVPVEEALQRVFPAAATAPAAAGEPRPAADEALYATLRQNLAAAIGDRRLELIRDARGLVVSMPDDAAFPTGSARATEDARAMLTRIGEALRDVPNAVRIEGHTDDVPIRTARYESNWELSTARASAVVAFLVGEAGLDAARLSAAGYGEFHPLGPNDTGAARARNRRVDVVILDASARGSGGDRAAP